MAGQYGCYYCGGAVVEKRIEVEYRWQGEFYIRANEAVK